ncbi:MAG: DUF975 family protein [Bacilli bacterium]|nr:DUF975 family protein [Bacilli bacterium]MDD4077432.1 DUF975 family protein [Bacilli bacterium]
MNFKEIKNEAKEALVGNRLMYFLALLVVGAIVGAASGACGLGVILMPIFMIGIFIFGKELIKNKKFEFNNVFVGFKDLNHALKAIGVHLLTLLIISLGLILFIVPGIIFALQYSQAIFILTENKEMTVGEAMKESKRIMDGHKIEFFLFNLSFILHFLLVAITFGFYYIYFGPYYSLAKINYYLHLTNQNVVKGVSKTLELDY